MPRPAEICTGSGVTMVGVAELLDNTDMMVPTFLTMHIMNIVKKKKQISCGHRIACVIAPQTVNLLPIYGLTFVQAE